MSLARCTFELEVHEVELPEESEEKERKVAAQRRVAQSRVVLRVTKDMWWRMGTWWLWKAELAQELARSLRTILPLVCQNHLLSGFRHLPSWTIKTLRKPCANLALPCSTTAFSWGPATKRKCKTCQRHSNVRLILFCLLYLFGKCPYIEIWVSVCILGWAMLSCIVHHQPSHPLFGLTPSSQQRSKGQEGHAWHGQQRGRVCRRPARHYEA